MDNNLPTSTNLEELKTRISEIAQKPLDTHSLEFEQIHSDLSNLLSEVDGL
ncbi:hypothetical protein MCEMZLE22_00720 [actinobacterium SCGC AAA044-D11]|uniref:Unannotated protein n=1 Tax=freshwater metagenome TaxID=449393 RepID=A0A6J6BSG9_9ZZZZ|nr:hypothetical protein [Actinomycetota bacterium]